MIDEHFFKVFASFLEYTLSEQLSLSLYLYNMKHYGFLIKDFSFMTSSQTVDKYLIRYPDLVLFRVYGTSNYPGT